MDQKQDRSEARAMALQTLYHIEINPDEVEVIARRLDTESFSLSKPLPLDAHEYFLNLVRGIREQQEKIDKVIQRFLKGWSFTRLAIVDRAILRLAVYELLYLPQIPKGVVVNEAIELAKTFSTEKSGKFVNGVLGSVVNHLDELRSGGAQ